MSNMYQQQQQNLYKQRSAEPLQQRPFNMKLPYQQQQSAYFPTTNTTTTFNNKVGINVSSSESSTAAPSTPQIFQQSLIHSNTPTKNDTGYESDSSEEGREPSPPQIQKLGLRVVNPDDEQDDDTMTNTPSSTVNNTSTNNNHAAAMVPSSSSLSPFIESEKKTQKKGGSPPPVAVTVTPAIKKLPLNSMDQQQQQQQQLLSPIPSETQWRVYQQQQQVEKPDLPPHHQQHLALRPVVSNIVDPYLYRRESKTLAAGDGTYYLAETVDLDTHHQAAIMAFNNTPPIIHQQVNSNRI